MLGDACASAETDFARWVAPFTGTAKPGNTFLGSCRPFGLVQASPDTGRGCELLRLQIHRRLNPSALVSRICREAHRPAPDGFCGNDDCGQTSAWPLFSMMGSHPFNPCRQQVLEGGELIFK
ncbi:MAG: glycoside hydrolase domain-containing protein [Kiritimatiellia bacterium]